MNTTRDYTISSVKRALDILKLFDESHRELTLSDLSQLSGIGKSSMLRFTYTLLQEDFLSYNPETRKYSVGLEMYRIGLSKFNSLDVTKFARRHLQKLADEMGMICYIGIRQGDMLAMVGQILPPTVPVWTQLTVLGGGVSQLYSTGIGRLFLSQDSDDEICRYLDRIQPKKYTDATITDRAELLELIHQAGKQKYSGNFGENESHIYSLCAPVYQMDGTMVAGVSLCGMQEDISGSNHDYYLSRILETAQAISKELGYFGS